MKYLDERNARIAEMLEIPHDGTDGEVFELQCARVHSRKTNVSAQGQIDVSIKMLVNGKVRYIPAECKTNGGRIDSLLDGSNKSKFVIYRLNAVQKHKATKTADAWIEERIVPAVVIPTGLFLDMLKDCNAIKEVRHNGMVDGLAIQPTSKKMYERLTAYVDNYSNLQFDNETTYEDWFFEGLEL